MDESLYRDLLRITGEIEELLALDGYDERLTPLVTRRQDLFGRMADVPLEEEYAVLIKRIKATEEKCMAMIQDKLVKIQGDLLAMNQGKRAIAAYEKQV
jgi:hypothetical protein